MKNKYSIFSLVKNAFSYHENWEKAWKDPEPKKEYSEDNQRQINRALSILIEQLNSTYLTQQKEDQERFTWLGLG